MNPCVYLDVDKNRSNLLGALDALLAARPRRVILIGDDALLRQRLELSGLPVDVLPARAQVPPGAKQVEPVIGNAASRAYLARLTDQIARFRQKEGAAMRMNMGRHDRLRPGDVGLGVGRK